LNKPPPQQSEELQMLYFWGRAGRSEEFAPLLYLVLGNLKYICS